MLIRIWNTVVSCFCVIFFVFHSHASHITDRVQLVNRGLNIKSHGLFGEEINNSVANVHHDIANNDWDGFRGTYSDHFPVTTCITIRADND